MLVITGGRLVTPEGLLEGAIALNDGRIVAVGDVEVPSDAEIVDASGLLVSPGLIDTHLHGGLLDDTMDASIEALRRISRHLAAHGITAWTPTTVACPEASLDHILTAVGRVMEEGSGGATVLGAHLESNFIAPAFHGAQPLDHLRPIGDAALEAVIERHAKAIRIITLAPELEGAERFIKRLRGLGIGVSLGHTAARYEEALAGARAGATRVTHLCNAMRGFHHREPGMLGAALVCDDLYTELIADKVHVHPAGMQIAYRCKGPNRLVLVTDGLRGTGLEPGTYDLGGQETNVDGTSARLSDGTLAGSVLTLNRAVNNAMDILKIPVYEALGMGSRTPADSLGLPDLGRLEFGARAHVALFDDQLRCMMTVIDGKIVHQAGLLAGSAGVPPAR